MDRQVLSLSGSFAGLYALAGYEDPVLASTIDGVGTKVMVAREMGTLRFPWWRTSSITVQTTCSPPAPGHSFSLDYVASGRLDLTVVAGGRAGERRRVLWRRSG